MSSPKRKALGRAVARIGQILTYAEAPFYGVVRLASFPSTVAMQKLPGGKVLFCKQLADHESWVGFVKREDGPESAKDDRKFVVLALPREELDIFPPPDDIDLP